jgi:DNA-binding transcriptional ArsR family regulator
VPDARDNDYIRASPAAISLVDVDPDFAAAIADPDRGRARRTLVARLHHLPPGPVNLRALGLPESTFALLVLRGAVLYEARAAAGRMVEFVLRGDLLLPHAPGPEHGLGRASLTATDAVLLAGLDQRFVQTAAVWPGLMVAVQRRLSEQLHRIALHGAICQLPNAEQRLMAMLWHLADRIGIVTVDGIVLARPLSHQTLAVLIGARRPTVSLALRSLRERGHLRRRDDGSWLLPRHLAGEESFDELIARLGADPQAPPARSGRGDGLLGATE